MSVAPRTATSTSVADAAPAPPVAVVSTVAAAAISDGPVTAARLRAAAFAGAVASMAATATSDDAAEASSGGVLGREAKHFQCALSVNRACATPTAAVQVWGLGKEDQGAEGSQPEHKKCNCRAAARSSLCATRQARPEARPEREREMHHESRSSHQQQSGGL
jgi:hypothetical protein